MIVVSRGNIDESGQLSSSSDDPLADNGFKNSLKVQNKKPINIFRNLPISLNLKLSNGHEFIFKLVISIFCFDQLEIKCRTSFFEFFVFFLKFNLNASFVTFS